ncbi:putative uncharacterized protein C8orf89 homolog isoform X2 [Engystomops pustulosus]|uniref:putative uncharacterized protein C8orf89 homolog isoform X2 n=1 Tax=Engystomops pustulosus TaxID=76066 RepID=UPI003AFACC6D
MASVVVRRHLSDGDLHIRGLNLLDFSCREERFMTTAPACNQHSNPFVLPAFKCRTLKHPLYIAKPFVSELTPAMAEKELLTTIYKANCNPTSFSGGVPGIKVNQFPRIQPCRGYTIYTSTLYRDSKAAHSAQVSQQKFILGYSDPLDGAPTDYIQRLSAIASLENETVRQENMRKLKTKKEEA